MKKLLKNYAEKYNIKTLILDFIPFYCFNFSHYIEENCNFLEKGKKTSIYVFIFDFFAKIEKFKKMHL